MKPKSRNSSLKILLLIIMAVGFWFSLFGNILLYSMNNQLSSTLDNQKLLVAKNIAFSLESLSDLPVPGPLTRENYSNLSIVEISNRHIVYHSEYGRLSIQQLINLDLAHGKNLTQIDKLFVSFEVFADNLNRLVSENKTSNAIKLIDVFSKTMSNLPTDLGWTLQSAYSVRGTVNEHELERASEQTGQIQALLESMITGTG
jgi:hypothetical protein